MVWNFSRVRVKGALGLEIGLRMGYGLKPRVGSLVVRWVGEWE